MKKLKDFLYDKNDILIAIIILVFAVLIIGWRMNAILEYPKQLIQNTESNVTDIDELLDSNGDNASTDNTQNESTDANQNNDTNPTDDQNTPETVPTSLWQDGKLTKSVEVEVSGNSASAAINCLIKEDLFDSYADYQKVCEGAGLDHEKVKAGSFTFKKGSTKADIAKTINWG